MWKMEYMMKKLTSLILILATVCVMSMTVVSCKDKAATTTTTVEATIEATDATADVVDATADAQ